MNKSFKIMQLDYKLIASLLVPNEKFVPRCISKASYNKLHMTALKKHTIIDSNFNFGKIYNANLKNFWRV